MDGIADLPVCRASGAPSRRLAALLALGLGLLLGEPGSWAISSSAASDLMAADSQPRALSDEAPLLVADAGHRFCNPPEMPVDYQSQFVEPRFDEGARHNLSLPSFASMANLRFERAEFSMPLPKEDFKELDEYRPKLTTCSLDANDQRSVVGGRLLVTRPLEDQGKFHTEARLLWLCEYLQSDGAGATAFFAPGDSNIFVTQGLSYGSNWALLGGRLRWDLVGGLSAFAGYDTQMNSQQMFHIGSTGLGYAW